MQILKVFATIQVLCSLSDKYFEIPNKTYTQRYATFKTTIKYKKYVFVYFYENT